MPDQPAAANHASVVVVRRHAGSPIEAPDTLIAVTALAADAGNATQGYRRL